MLDAQSLKGWLLLVSVSVCVGALILLSERYLVPAVERRTEKLGRMRAANTLIPAVLMMFGFLGFYVISDNNAIAKLLPPEMQARVQSINFQQHSVRGTAHCV
ncbi:hypothetical protein CBW46_008325 [Paenibacillus xerothermodurans]|uniref:Uncharacterized protein n=1 Tax=Paenibacillus xerothermodurans TaxID=1977292 RepID=A0A2W1NUD1_PAEXE|nr:hypothetical protein CBW46_008325 [Paenibacillus xerothermodurans]